MTNVKKRPVGTKSQCAPRANLHSYPIKKFKSPIDITIKRTCKQTSQEKISALKLSQSTLTT